MLETKRTGRIADSLYLDQPATNSGSAIISAVAADLTGQPVELATAANVEVHQSDTINSQSEGSVSDTINSVVDLDPMGQPIGRSATIIVEAHQSDTINSQPGIINSTVAVDLTGKPVEPAITANVEANSSNKSSTKSSTKFDISNINSAVGRFFEY